MKQFDSKPNVIGDLLKAAREKKHYSKVDLSTKLELLGVNISREEIYRIESYNMIVKDFELIALCIALDIDYKDLKELILKD